MISTKAIKLTKFVFPGTSCLSTIKAPGARAADGARAAPCKLLILDNRAPKKLRRPTTCYKMDGFRIAGRYWRMTVVRKGGPRDIYRSSYKRFLPVHVVAAAFSAPLGRLPRLAGSRALLPLD